MSSNVSFPESFLRFPIHDSCSSLVCHQFGFRRSSADIKIISNFAVSKRTSFPTRICKPVSDQHLQASSLIPSPTLHFSLFIFHFS